MCIPALHRPRVYFGCDFVYTYQFEIPLLRWLALSAANQPHQPPCTHPCSIVVHLQVLLIEPRLATECIVQHSLVENDIVADEKQSLGPGVAQKPEEPLSDLLERLDVSQVLHRASLPAVIDAASPGHPCKLVEVVLRATYDTCSKLDNAIDTWELASGFSAQDDYSPFSCLGRW